MSNILLNGTEISLVTGEPHELYQGYALSLKSVSNDGSIWLQLSENGRTVKSEIVSTNGYFIYNKSEKTILSLRVSNVYSGSAEQNLVSLYPVYQYLDIDLPAPTQTEIKPDDSSNMPNGTSPARISLISLPMEPLIWTLGVAFLIILFYILRKLW